MKTLQKFINEKLVINKDSVSESFLERLENAKNESQFYDIIIEISESALKEPDIYDDMQSFDVSNYFEPWQDVHGDWDGTYAVLKEWCNDNGVLGWHSDIDFSEVEKIMPPMFNEIIKTWPREVVYKSHGFLTETWSKKLGKADCTLLRCNLGVNDDGRDYYEYWYMFITHI